MLDGLPPLEWLRFRDLGPKEMAACLRELAAKVSLEKVRKAKNKPKRTKKKDVAYDPSKPHISTARLLATHRAKSRAAANAV